jgi:hypothetical protein
MSSSVLGTMGLICHFLFMGYRLLKLSYQAGCWCLMPVILADQEDHSLKSAQANSSVRPYIKKTLYKKGLVE